MRVVDQTDDRYAMFGRDSDRHDPRPTLDVEAHWDWRNPLIALPLGVLLIVIASVILKLLPP
jgi:hypothetical protein